VFDEIDLDLDGLVSYKEFVVAVDQRKGAVKSKRVTNRTRIEQAWDLLLNRVNTEEWDETVDRLFSRIDGDHSGMLDFEELGQTLHSLGSDLTKEEMILFFDETDDNLDRKVSRHEFMAAVDKRKPAHKEAKADFKHAESKN
jgi:Ca2+-binding EF-hand superfamily protein